MNEKVIHVRRAIRSGKTGNHGCHWPGCTSACAPAAWGCKRHWMMLPHFLRNKIWANYRAGQEVSKSPSREYVSVAQEVQAWIRDNYPPTEHGMEFDL